MERLYRQTESIIFSPTLAPSTVAEIITENGKLSPKIKDIKTAQRYYDGHSDIESKERVYFDKDGKKHDNPAANNAKIKSNFLRMLVQQKQDYALAKTFNLKLSNENNEEIDLSKDEYGIEWRKFCDRQLFKKSHILAGIAVNCGIAWAYLWIGEDGELMLKDVPSELVYPVWHDRQHTSLERLAYNFMQLRYYSSNPDEVEYVEYWTDKERYLFNVSTGYQPEADFFDDDENPIFSHMTGGESWGKIPFVAFKGTVDEKPLLSFVKEYIDCYERLNSNSTDSLIDDLDPLLVLKGVSPSVEDLIEARELAKMTRTMSLDSDGDAHYIQAQTQISAYLEKMSAIRKDIFKFGYGVDTQDARVSGNPNQLEIKSYYQDLDTYIDGLERNFQSFIDDLKYFFDKWWELTGRGSFDIAQSYKVAVQFDRSMLVNKTALIDDCLKLQSTGISQKTILENNPAVQDVEIELQRIEEERAKSEAENPLFNFPKDEGTTVEGEEEEEEEE